MIVVNILSCKWYFKSKVMSVRDAIVREILYPTSAYNMTVTELDWIIFIFPLFVTKNLLILILTRFT